MTNEILCLCPLLLWIPAVCSASWYKPSLCYCCYMWGFSLCGMSPSDNQVVQLLNQHSAETSTLGLIPRDNTCIKVQKNESLRSSPDNITVRKCNICIYIYTYVYIYTDIHMYIYVCMRHFSSCGHKKPFSAFLSPLQHFQTVKAIYSLLDCVQEGRREKTESEGSFSFSKGHWFPQ